MKLIKARKSHQCHWCGGEIEKNETYSSWLSVFKENPEDFPICRIKMHQECCAAQRDDNDEYFFFYFHHRPDVRDILYLKEHYDILNFDFLRYARLSESYAEECLDVCREEEEYHKFTDEVSKILEEFRNEDD